MNVKEKVKLQRLLRENRKAFVEMEYPSHVQPDYEWYMRTVPSKAEEGTKIFKAAFIQIMCCGYRTNSSDFGSVRLDDPNFVEKWTSLVARAKTVIDTLNADPADATLTLCECSAVALPGDYLCTKCREEANENHANS